MIGPKDDLRHEISGPAGRESLWFNVSLEDEGLAVLAYTWVGVEGRAGSILAVVNREDEAVVHATAADVDAAGRTELVATLRAYLEAGGHQRQAAGRCHIATSTLKYRMAKVRDLLGRDPGDPEVGFELMLAFKLRDLLAATAATPASAETAD